MSISFANEEVKRQWTNSKPSQENVTKVEKKDSLHYSAMPTGVRMYANPVERERMIIEKAQRQQIANEQRLAMFNVFSRKNNK